METINFTNSGMRQCITYFEFLFQELFVQWIAAEFRLQDFQNAKSSVPVSQIQLRPAVSGIMKKSDTTIRIHLLCCQLLEKARIFYDVNHDCAKITYFCMVMRKSCLKIIILLILFSAGVLNLHAQNVTQTDWNQALDRYEQICNQCISLRNDIQNGIQVPTNKVSTLFQELARLRAMLQNASGSMTNGQKRRFSEIRDRYQSQLDSSANQKGVVSKPVSKSSVTSKQPDKPLPLDIKAAVPDFVAQIMPLTIPDSLSFSETVIRNYSPGISKASGFGASEAKVTSDYWRVHVMGMIDMGSVTQYGMTLAVGMKKYGLLIGAVSNFKTVSSQYECYKDGSINGGGYFWGDGSVADTRSRLLAGIYWSPIDKLMLYANSGYSSVSRYWHDTLGQWARVIDLSGKGALFGAGVIVPIRHLSLTSGIQYDSFTKSVMTNVGVGFNFSINRKS